MERREGNHELDESRNASVARVQIEQLNSTRGEGEKERQKRVLTRLHELKSDAIVLLERLVEARLREVLEGMIGGFFGAGGTIILHSPGVPLLAPSSFFLVDVAADVTHNLPPTGCPTSLPSPLLFAFTNVVRRRRDDDSLLLLRLKISLLTRFLPIIVVHWRVVDSQ